MSEPDRHMTAIKLVGGSLFVISLLLLFFFSIYGVLEREPTLTIAAGAGLIAGSILLAGAHVAEALKSRA